MIIVDFLFFVSTFGMTVMTIIIVNKLYKNQFTEIDEYQRKDEYLEKTSNHMKNVKSYNNKKIVF